MKIIPSVKLLIPIKNVYIIASRQLINNGKNNK